MRTLRFLVFIVLVLTSCNTYRYADYYSGFVLKTNGLKLYEFDLEKYDLTYWDSGTNKMPLVLIHGFSTSGKFQWYKEVDDLSKDFRLIIVNLLYFGSRPKKPLHSIDAQTDAIETLLEKLKINSYYVCATSYGGLVASELAAKHPDKIKKLVLMDTPLKFLTDADTKKVCKKYDIKDPQELYIPGDPAMFKKLLSISYFKAPELPTVILRSFYKNTYGEEKADLKKIYESYVKGKEAFDSKDYHFKMPVLLIWGEEDQLVPLHVGQELKQYIGVNARLEVVPEAGHLPNLENEKVVNKMILDFLKEK